MTPGSGCPPWPLPPVSVRPRGVIEASLEGQVRAKSAVLKAYDHYLAGQDVRQTLRQAQHFLWVKAMPVDLALDNDASWLP